MRVGRRIAGLRTGRRLGRAPVRRGGCGDCVRRQGVLDLLHTDPATPNFVPEDVKMRHAFLILTRQGLRFECSSSCEIQRRSNTVTCTGRAPPRQGSCYWSSADDQNDHNKGATD
ncbi:uncharacterized protein LOC123410113 [Hordeum vulgare subsp. vulgare]|uniref:uncharacterized protein LOC123410113 n=1 Tax=Hordeum vulgare subsp. vulgare TaxID=112509 RepID=UPI001D1A5A60|nr:uncharacterized protein LOC123410113 [Hordeum vulgare subsp. vulgare]